VQPENLRYSDTHEWVKVEDNLATIGITDHAQSELGDIVYLELPQTGTTVQKGDVFGSIESVKTVSDLVAPVSGEIVEVNEELPETPELVNDSPYGTGWLVIIKLEDPSEVEDLMTAEAYENFIQES
jgi:glycine cleavage system H protein